MKKAGKNDEHDDDDTWSESPDDESEDNKDR